MKAGTLALFLAVSALARDLPAQVVTSVPPASNPPATINVFLDCSYNCDFDFIRTEIPYVNWMRDRTDADIHLLVTVQSTGGGGSEYVLNFLGQRGFAQMSDTLKYVASVNATDDDRRKGYTQAIKSGLVRYVAKTSGADRLRISFASADAEATEPKTAQNDPWKAWVFSLSANGNAQGDRHYKGLRGGL